MGTDGDISFKKWQAACKAAGGQCELCDMLEPCAKVGPKIAPMHADFGDGLAFSGAELALLEGLWYVGGRYIEMSFDHATVLDAAGRSHTTLLSDAAFMKSLKPYKSLDLARVLGKTPEITRHAKALSMYKDSVLGLARLMVHEESSSQYWTLSLTEDKMNPYESFLAAVDAQVSYLKGIYKEGE